MSAICLTFVDISFRASGHEFFTLTAVHENVFELEGGRLFGQRVFMRDAGTADLVMQQDIVGRAHARRRG